MHILLYIAYTVSQLIYLINICACSFTSNILFLILYIYIVIWNHGIFCSIISAPPLLAWFSLKSVCMCVPSYIFLRFFLDFCEDQYRNFDWNCLNLYNALLWSTFSQDSSFSIFKFHTKGLFSYCWGLFQVSYIILVIVSGRCYFIFIFITGSLSLISVVIGMLKTPWFV